MITIAIPKRKCFHPSCRDLISFTDTYCDTHKQTVNTVYKKALKRDNPEYVRFYKSSSWKSARAVTLLRDDYMCLMCLANGVNTIANMVDHIIPSLDNWNKRLEQSNLQSLCWSCHNKKTANEIKNKNESRPSF